MCVWVVARLPQRLKSTFLWNFFIAWELRSVVPSLWPRNFQCDRRSWLQTGDHLLHWWIPFGYLRSKKFQKNADFSLWGKQCIVSKLHLIPRFSSLCEVWIHKRCHFKNILITYFKNSKNILKFIFSWILRSSFES